MKKKIIDDIREFKSMIGTHLGKSKWIKVTQKKITNFARVTEDFQWIHIDIDKAKLESPYKKTIAHGYYTLSLLPKFFSEIWECKDVDLILNYGSEKIRFISPVVCNSQIRASIKLMDVYSYKNGIMLKSKVDIEVKSKDKLAMSAEILSLLFSKNN